MAASWLLLMAHILSMLTRIDRGHGRILLNNVLHNIPIGTTYVWLVSQILWRCFGEDGYDRVWDEYYNQGLCSLSDLSAQKTLEEVGTAVRRTGRWLDGNELSTQTLGHIVNANLFVGRARFSVKWEPEYHNRCDPDYQLQYYERETNDTEVVLHKLKTEIDAHLRPVVHKLRLTSYS